MVNCTLTKLTISVLWKTLRKWKNKINTDGNKYLQDVAYKGLILEYVSEISYNFNKKQSN